MPSPQQGGRGAAAQRTPRQRLWVCMLGKGPQDSVAGPAVPTAPVGRGRAVRLAQRPRKRKAKESGRRSPRATAPDGPTHGSSARHGAQNPRPLTTPPWGPSEMPPTLAEGHLHTLWLSGLSGGGGQPQRGHQGWGCLTELPPLPGGPSPGCPVSLSAAQALPPSTRSPVESALEEGERGGAPGKCPVDDGTEKNGPLALVLTPHLENGDNVLAVRDSLLLNIQRTSAMWGTGATPTAPRARTKGLPSVTAEPPPTPLMLLLGLESQGPRAHGAQPRAALLPCRSGAHLLLPQLGPWGPCP